MATLSGAVRDPFCFIPCGKESDILAHLEELAEICTALTSPVNVLVLVVALRREGRQMFGSSLFGSEMEVLDPLAARLDLPLEPTCVLQSSRDSACEVAQKRVPIPR
ncbi:uncharacterized protein [Physcomitrium patens]|uniref:uncharacterized protein n=1 Tax=Physcomitrium patens TaxID=3218 RepID=UPI000D169E1A|nr:uncharacterized protein LOC112279016 [Physcomitrium patens]|eukprot:XP_024368814.1 uncharacterized protein LOC112279016 [Physcomitrella patens]